MRLRRVPVSIFVVIAVLAGSELAVRAVSSKLEQPLVWVNREAQNKVAAMDALRRSAGGASVAFVGSSMTQAAVEPSLMTRLIGSKRPAFNAALDGIDMRALEFWTLNVVVPRLKPRAVVIGLSSRELSDVGKNQRTFAKTFFASPAVKRLDGRAGRLERLEAWTEKHSYVFRYRTVLRRPADARAIPGPTDVGPLGITRALPAFQSRPFDASVIFRDRISKRVLNNYAVGKRSLASLDRIVRALDRRGITAVIVEMPITSEAISLHPHGATDYAAFERAMARFIATHKVGFIPMRSSFVGTSEFVDPFHLNTAGAKRFTELLAPRVRSALAAAGSP